MAQATKTTGPEQIHWALTDLFKSPTDPAIEATLADSLKRAQAFEARFKGKVVSLPPREFAAMMRELEDDEELAAKPDVYAYLLHSQNTEDAAAGRLLARVREAGAERGRPLVFFTLELAQISDEQAARLYAEPESAGYRHMVEEARKFRPHQLSEPEERVLTDFSPVGNAAWNRLFEELSARIRVDLDGRQLPLEEALVRLREPDRAVRREASAAITTALDRDVKTRAYIYNVILGEKAIDDRLRHFPTWISSRNLANETSDEAVQALVEAVTGRYDVCVRYYRVKKNLLGVGELHEWDRYAPIGEAGRDLTWEDAKELVLGAYRRFSKRAGDLVEDFFNRGWIDAPVIPGKAGGAYCMPVTPRHHPAEGGPGRGRAVWRGLSRKAPGDVRRLIDPHRRAQGVVELRQPLPTHARLRLRLRVRQSARALDLPPLPAGGAELRRRLPGISRRGRFHPAGRARPAAGHGHHRPGVLGRRFEDPGRHGQRGRATRLIR